MSEYVRLPIEGMTCTSCASRISRAVRKLVGVESVRIDLGSDSADVVFEPAHASLAQIANAIRAAGYEPRVEHAEPFTPAKLRSLPARLGLGSRRSMER
jgi:Cu+-exporting ATPase